MLDLKSACTVLKEHCNSTPVGVRAAPLFVRDGIGWLGRIVQQAKCQDWIAAKVVEIGFLEVKRKSEAVHQGLGQTLHLPNIRDHGILEFRKMRRPLIGPDVGRVVADSRMIGHKVLARQKSFLQIRWRAGFQCLRFQRLVTVTAG